MNDPKQNWGPAIWNEFHRYASQYTPNKYNEFLHFLNSMITKIPCNVCKTHFIEKIGKFPPQPYMGSAEDLFLWTYIIHDIANRDITKRYYDDISKNKQPMNTPKRSISYQEVKRVYF